MQDVEDEALARGRCLVDDKWLGPKKSPSHYDVEPLTLAKDVEPREKHATGMRDIAAGEETLSGAATAETRSLDGYQPAAVEDAKFRRGQLAIDLLEAIRVTEPDLLADVAGWSHDTSGELPRTIGRFRILRELGRGGYGVVLLAHDPHLNRRVALKIPRPEALVTADLRRRFLREAEAAAALNHPNIVPIYEQGMVGPICYVASAYYEGQSLAEWLARQPRPVSPQQAARIVESLADAVQHAHSRGVLHRDLKPANILMVREGDGQATDSTPFTPLIIDFGLARIEGCDGQTNSTAIVGTPAYMAPEQAAGRNDEVGAAVDIHGLGTILYQLLTLQLPYRGRSDLETLQAIQFHEPVAPRRVHAGIPWDLEAVCLKCLEKLPVQRYASAASLNADLGRFLSGQAVEARPIGPAERLRRWCRRNPALAATSALAGLLFVTGSASVCWQWLRAERSLIEAHEQQDRATRNLRAAQDAVDELLTGIAAEMSDLPQTEAIRKRLLSRAAAINQRFLRDESIDMATVGLDAIKAWRRSAEIAWQMQDVSAAENSLQKVISLCESMSSVGHSAEVTAEHVIALCKLSGVAEVRGDLEKSQRILHDGLTMLDAVPADLSPELGLWRAELLRSLGILAEGKGDPAQAGRFFHQALELAADFPSSANENVEVLRARAKFHNSYAIHCKQMERFDEATKHFESTQTILAVLRDRFPETAEYQALIAQNQYNLANLEVAAGRFDQARSRYLSAKNDFKQLAARFPQVVKYRDMWCHSLQGASSASKEPDRFKSRIILLKKAAFLREEIMREHPEMTQNILQLARTHRNLGRDYELAKDYDEARRCYRRAIACNPGETASDAERQQDGLGDALAYSLLAQLESDRGDWEAARDLFEQAIATRKKAKGNSVWDSNSQAEQWRDLAGLGLATAHCGRIQEGLQYIRELPSSQPELTTSDMLAAKALLDVVEILEDHPTGDLSLQNLQGEAIDRLRSAWKHGDSGVREFVTDRLKENLGEVPAYQVLVEEMTRGK